MSFLYGAVMKYYTTKPLVEYNTPTGEQIKKMEGTVYSMLELPDGRLAVSYTIEYCDYLNYVESGVKVYDEKFARKYIFNGHESNILDLALLPNDNIVSCGQDKTIRIWELQNNHEIYKDVSKHEYFGIRDTTINIYAYQPYYKCTKILNGHISPVMALSVLPNGNIVSGSDNGRINIWDSDTGECTFTFSVGTERILSLGLLSDEKIVVQTDDHVKIYTLNGECTNTIYVKYNECRMKVLANDDIAVLLDDRTLGIYTKNNVGYYINSKIPGNISAFTVGANGNIYIYTFSAVNNNYEIQIYDDNTYQYVQTAGIYQNKINGMTVMKDSSIITYQYISNDKRKTTDTIIRRISTRKN